MKEIKNWEEGKKIRNHFSYVFEKIWSLIIVLGAIAIGNIGALDEGMDVLKKGDLFQYLLISLGSVLFLVILVLWHVNRWWKTTITIGDGTIIYERRTLNRYVNNISVSKISNINLEQNLFEMVMGTYKLKLDTNSLSTAESTDMEIVLKKEQAYAVKHVLMQMIQKEQEVQNEAVSEQNVQDTANQDVSGTFDDRRQKNGYLMDEEDLPFDVEYSMKEVIKNGLVMISVAQVICCIALCVAAVISAMVAYDEKKDITSALGVFLVQFLVAFSIIGNTIKNALQDFHFRAKREGDKIFVSCGLFKKRNYAVPVDMINSVVLAYTFIGRVCKKAYVKVLNVGGEKDDVDGMKILLTGSYQELEEKLAILLPEWKLPQLSSMQKAPKAAFVRSVLASLLWCVIAGVASFPGISIAATEKIPNWGYGIWGGAIVVFLLLLILIGFLRYRTAGLYLGQKRCVISRGVCGKQIILMPYERIQTIHLKEGPVEHLLGVQSGEVKILASALSRNQNLGRFAKADFEKFVEKFQDHYERI